MLLTDTFRRLAHICEDLHVEVVQEGHPADILGGPWLSFADVATGPEALSTALDGESARILAAHGRTARPDVVASRLLHRYLWAAGLLISGPWYLSGQVPELAADRLWTNPVTGVFALAPGEFTATNEPQAVRASVERFARPLLDAFRPRLKRGPHALWGMVGDDLVAGVWYLGRKLDEEQRAVRKAESLLPGPDGARPFPSGADFRTLRSATGRTYVTRTRTGCCLHYTIQPTKTCRTCPRLCDSERLRRLEAESPRPAVARPAAASGRRVPTRPTGLA
ncbi:hypothetical protein EDD99_3291 [Streptomyces sp. 846.5]|nr:(2Fe-2S)-binding protein [Streptomyces sp. 846.5]TDU04816.1 hypothetical protein EDD99_3291 [Streptomyces sp. 846.5]